MISDGGPKVATLLTRTTADTWKLYVAPRSRDVTRAELTLAPTERVLSVHVCVCVCVCVCVFVCVRVWGCIHRVYIVKLTNNNQ